MKRKIITQSTLRFPCREIKSGFAHLNDNLHTCLSSLVLCLASELNKYSINKISHVNKQRALIMYVLQRLLCQNEQKIGIEVKGTGTEEIVQWIKPVLYKHEDWNSDLEHSQARWAGLTAQL